MEPDPTTEHGKSLHGILSNSMSQSPEAAMDTIKRLFIPYAPKIQNADSFIDILYGQRVLDDPDGDLLQQRPLLSAGPQTRDAITACLSKRCVKELIVALEWSNNEAILAEILKWAEKAGTTSTIGLLTTVLAPERVVRTFSSLLSGGPVQEREREVSLNGRVLKRCGVCRDSNKIILGFDNCTVKIFTHVDLQWETVLSYDNQPSECRSFQCICTGIIAGYDDGNICAFDIKSGKLMQKISVRNGEDNDFPIRMKWKGPDKLVLATHENTIQTWCSSNSAFVLLGVWNHSAEFSVRVIEFDENYIILQDREPYSIHVHLPNGQLLRTIESPGNTAGMAYEAEKIITGGQDTILRIWDVQTGACLHELEGHNDDVNFIQVQNHNAVLCASGSGVVTLWGPFHKTYCAVITAKILQTVKISVS